jgi:hypothetical protein
MSNIVNNILAPFRWGTRGTKRLAPDDNAAATTTNKRHTPDKLAPLDTRAAQDIGKANLESLPTAKVTCASLVGTYSPFFVICAIDVV